MVANIPRILEPLELAALLPHEKMRIVDVGSRKSFLQGRLHDAVHLDYARLIRNIPPAVGLPPTLDELKRVLQSIGFAHDQYVVAYDDQGNGRASRLLWTLEAVGHTRSSLLNGGIGAWRAANYPIARGHDVGDVGDVNDINIEWNPAVIADKADVLAALHNPNITILDARSAAEYHGLKSPSARNGRIPGARNLNWLDTMTADHFRIKPEAELRALLHAIGVPDDAPDHEIITYCQTHHRSAHLFMVLRHLGFANVRGYAGSWAQWGNDPNLPIETG